MMDLAFLFLRLLLAVVFGLAGVTKLADMAGSRDAMRSFGLPARVAPVAAVALPIAELAVAMLLLPVSTAWWAALAGLVLLGAFVAGIGVNLAQGRTPDCHCFGQVYSEPIGRGTLVRNGVLAILTLGLVVRGRDGQGASLVGWLGETSTTERVLLAGVAILFVVVAGFGWLLVQIMQQNGRLLLRIETLEGRDDPAGAHVRPASTVQERGLPVGAVAPNFTLPSLAGGTVSLGQLRDNGRSTLIVFTDPACGPCAQLMPDIARWQREYADELTVAVISRGAVDANEAKAAEHGLARDRILLQHGNEVSSAYQSLPTPSGVLVRGDGTIGSQAAAGAKSVRALVTEVMTREVAVAQANGDGSTNGTGHRPAASRIGEPVPNVVLRDLSGSQVPLQQLEGEPTLLLFWNPGCSYCQRMLPELKAWEAESPPGAPRLVVVSRGSVEDNAAQGLRSMVLLDQPFATGRAVGSTGTPSAVLLDAEGRIASGLATGATSVFALAGAAPARS